jgi:hypothetical protein
VDLDTDPTFHADPVPGPTTHFFSRLDRPMLQNDPLKLPPFNFDADPDPAFHFDADPDPSFHFEADPDPAFYFDVDRNSYPYPDFHFGADPCGSRSVTLLLTLWDIRVGGA